MFLFIIWFKIPDQDPLFMHHQSTWKFKCSIKWASKSGKVRYLLSSHSAFSKSQEQQEMENLCPDSFHQCWWSQSSLSCWQDEEAALGIGVGISLTRITLLTKWFADLKTARRQNELVSNIYHPQHSRDWFNWYGWLGGHPCKYYPSFLELCENREVYSHTKDDEWPSGQGSVGPW